MFILKVLNAVVGALRWVYSSLARPDPYSPPSVRVWPRETRYIVVSMSHAEKRGLDEDIEQHID